MPILVWKLKMASSQSGGMFSTPKVEISTETQKLLKVMMQESKLTNFQQRKLNENLRGGRSLPVKCGPTSSEKKSVRVNPQQKKKAPTPGNGKRSKTCIDSLKDTQGDENYKPPMNAYNSQKEKNRLQSIMAFGEEVEDSEKLPAIQLSEEDREEIDRFDEVLQEIEDRKQFLAEMEAIGQGKKYQNIIHTEISQKIRELELIDKQRCKELSIASESS